MTELFRTLEISDPLFERDGLRTVTVKSGALGCRADVSVWVPAAERVDTLLILLHGVYGSHWVWSLKGGAHRMAEQMIAAGEIAPMVIAMPSDGLRRDGSGYLCWPDADVERFIVDEMPALARFAAPALRTDARVGIAGLSMGGMGRCASVGSMQSGSVRSVRTPPSRTLTIWLRSSRSRYRNTLRAERVRIWMRCTGCVCAARSCRRCALTAAATTACCPAIAGCTRPCRAKALAISMPNILAATSGATGSSTSRRRCATSTGTAASRDRCVSCGAGQKHAGWPKDVLVSAQ